MIPVIIATASKIGTLWKNGDLELKKKIQNLVFPEGIFWVTWTFGVMDFPSKVEGGHFG